MTVRTYQDLDVRKESIRFVLNVYQSCERFPQQERFGLTMQLRKAAVSIASNIAESEGRFTPGERVQFVSQARGSLFEVETQLILSRELGYLDVDTSDSLLAHAARVGQLINGFAKYLRRKRAQILPRATGNGLRATRKALRAPK